MTQLLWNIRNEFSQTLERWWWHLFWLQILISLPIWAKWPFFGSFFHANGVFGIWFLFLPIEKLQLIFRNDFSHVICKAWPVDFSYIANKLSMRLNTGRHNVILLSIDPKCNIPATTTCLSWNKNLQDTNIKTIHNANISLSFQMSISFKTYFISLPRKPSH